MPVMGITPIIRITQAREEVAALLTMYRRSSTTLEEDIILRRRSDTIKVTHYETQVLIYPIEIDPSYINY